MGTKDTLIFKSYLGSTLTLEYLCAFMMGWIPMPIHGYDLFFSNLNLSVGFMHHNRRQVFLKNISILQT